MIFFFLFLFSSVRGLDWLKSLLHLFLIPRFKHLLELYQIWMIGFHSTFEVNKINYKYISLNKKVEMDASSIGDEKSRVYCVVEYGTLLVPSCVAISINLS